MQTAFRIEFLGTPPEEKNARIFYTYLYNKYNVYTKTDVYDNFGRYMNRAHCMYKYGRHATGMRGDVRARVGIFHFFNVAQKAKGKMRLYVQKKNDKFIIYSTSYTIPYRCRNLWSFNRYRRI